MAAASLMDLPTELRLQILREVFTFGKSYLRCRRFYLSGVPILKRLWQGPLLTNRQIRSEALTIIFGDPLWRLVTNQYTWGIHQNDILKLLALQRTNELALIRRWRWEFDLDRYHGMTRGFRLADLSQHVEKAASGMIICCDMLAVAAAPLDIEIAWMERVHSDFWEATLGMLSPLSRLSNLRSIIITQYWQQEKDHGASQLLFAQHLQSLTGITPIWSLPQV